MTIAELLAWAHHLKRQLEWPINEWMYDERRGDDGA